MFGLGNNEDEEKMWNFMLFKFYGTDKELEEYVPTIIITIILIIIFWVIIWFAFK